MKRIFFIFFAVAWMVTEVSMQQNVNSDGNSLSRLHNGNLCTMLCSGSSSAVGGAKSEPSSSEHGAFDSSLFLYGNNKQQLDIEAIKELVRNNSAELTRIRAYLNGLLRQDGGNPSTETGGDDDDNVRDVRIVRAALTSLGRQRSLSTKSDMENQVLPVIAPTASDSEIIDRNLNIIKTIPKDCEEIRLALGRYFIGRYYTQIKPSSDPLVTPFLAGCELREDAGWTVIQRRIDGSLSFDRSWDEYKLGFGNVEGEFWMGNDNIHRLTNQKPYRLRIELQTGSGRKFYAEYSQFRIADEADSYRLDVTGFVGGSAGDSLTGVLSHNGSFFTTRDRDNDRYEAGNCAAQYHGGWWFHSCFVAFLNGIIANPAPTSTFTTRDSSNNNWHLRKVRSFYVPAISQDGIVWRTINKRQTRDSAYYDDVAIKMAVMMVAPAF